MLLGQLLTDDRALLRSRVELVQRALTARHLPGFTVTAAIGDAVGADPIYLQRLQQLAQDQHDQPPVNDEFNRIVAASGMEVHSAADTAQLSDTSSTVPPEPVDEPQDIAPGRWVTAIFVLALLPIVGIGAWVADHVDIAQDLVFDSGDEPKLYEMDKVCGFGRYICLSNNYEWTIAAGGQANTTFRRGPDIGLRPERLQGTLTTQPGCDGASIDWTIRIDGGAPQSGTLTGTARRTLDVPVHADVQKITATARRTDNLACEAILRWEEPMLGDQRP